MVLTPSQGYEAMKVASYDDFLLDITGTHSFDPEESRIYIFYNRAEDQGASEGCLDKRWPRIRVPRNRVEVK